jgi:DNA-binding NtrC family response regulator
MLTISGVAPSPQALKTILIVDDDHILRMTVADCLRDCNYDVCEAETADEAVRFLEDGLAVDVVISDVMMSGRMNGIDFAVWLEQNRPEVPMILASGAVGLDQAAKKLLAVTHCLPKPFGISELEAAICGAIDDHAHSEHAARIPVSNPSEAALLLLA